jgi:hypothetical protein
VINTALVYQALKITPSDSYIWDVELVRILQTVVARGHTVRVTIDESDCMSPTINQHLAQTLPEWRAKWPHIQFRKQGQHFFLTPK